MWFSPTLPKQHLAEQQQDSQAKRPLVTLDVALGHLVLDSVWRQAGQARLVESLHRVGPLQRQVERPRVGGERTQERLVQARLDDVAVRVLEELEATGLRVGQLDQFPLGRAETDGENFHADVVRFLGDIGNAGLVVLAVGHHHEHLVVVLLFFKCPQRLGDRFADGRAALRDDVSTE